MHPLPHRGFWPKAATVDGHRNERDRDEEIMMLMNEFIARSQPGNVLKRNREEIILLVNAMIFSFLLLLSMVLLSFIVMMLLLLFMIMREKERKQ